MGLRRYTDPTGSEWNVWDVPPRYTTQRSMVERRRVATPGFSPERRKTPDRRVSVPPPEWVYGWITFQNETEKLRLCPMPRDWEALPDEELERYRRKAKPVARPSTDG